MFKDILTLYQIGKNLGLSRREINKILIFDNTNHPTLYLVLMIVGIIATVIFGVTMVILGIYLSRNTYPVGAEYSAIKSKDFKRKK